MINKQSYESVGTKRFSFQERKPINGDDMVSDNTVTNGYLNHLEMS